MMIVQYYNDPEPLNLLELLVDDARRGADAAVVEVGQRAVDGERHLDLAPERLVTRELGGRARVPRGAGPVIWLHAVSVGEVNLLQPLIQNHACQSFAKAMRRKRRQRRLSI